MEAKDNIIKVQHDKINELKETVEKQQTTIDRISDENTSLKNDLASMQNEFNAFKALVAPLIDQANSKNDSDK